MHFSAGLDRLAHDALASLPNAISRLWDRDPTLWTPDPEHHAVAQNRLGWLDAPYVDLDPSLGALQTSLAAEGVRHAILLGMGGSSLCPDVLRRVGGTRGLDFHVLDSTHPESVAACEARVDLLRTVFIVASKSGGTIEVRSFYQYFRHRVPNPNAFIAITDPGSPLQALAHQEGFRACFLNPPDIGGRYSALSLFGLVPACLLGMDSSTLLASARTMAEACRRPPAENPGFGLGSVLGAAARSGRNKLTLALSPDIAPLGSWIEQLVAESTGKEGQGILPVDGEPLGGPDDYGRDRVFVSVSTPGHAPEGLESLEAAGHPVIRWQISGPDALGGEFFRWEVATAVAAAVMQVDPFDEPNVAAAKRLSGEQLELHAQSGQIAESNLISKADGVSARGRAAIASSPAEALERHLDRIGEGDYLALLAFLPEHPELVAELESLRLSIRRKYRVATTVGFGPRFLHSTGQLHKGGPGTGVFVQFTANGACDLPVPGHNYSFAVLCAAQARGDELALEEAERRVIRIHLGDQPGSALRHLREALIKR